MPRFVLFVCWRGSNFQNRTSQASEFLLGPPSRMTPRPMNPMFVEADVIFSWVNRRLFYWGSMPPSLSACSQIAT